MPSFKVVWSGDQDEMSRIADLLSEVYYPPADAVSLTKKDAVKEDANSGWSVGAYFADAPDLVGIDRFLFQAGIVIPGKIEELADRDWVAHSLEGLGIIRCGRFVLYGIHDEDKLPDQPGDVPIRIDANQAFGTGHHPTTAGCLEVLDRLADQAPVNVLDLGTGSAILAIAAAKLWQTTILATDIDSTSVEIAAENARLNSASGISFLSAAGFDHAEISARAPFDFIFANILAGPLVEFAPGMSDHMAQAGMVILAGLLAEQELGVTAAYRANGFDLERRHQHETWPVLVFTKTSS